MKKTLIALARAARCPVETGKDERETSNMRRELIALSVAEYGLRAAEASSPDALGLDSRRALSIMMREGFDMKTHLIAAAALPASSPQAQCGRHIAVEIALDWTIRPIW